MTTAADVRVCAVVVLYNPDSNTLNELLQSVTSQVHQVLLVNNSPEIGLERTIEVAPTPKPLAIYQADNMGVGHAHNVGIEWAQAHGYSHLLLLDQDSIPSRDMVEQLLSAEQRLVTEGVYPAALGPRWSSDGIIWSPFVRLGFPFTKQRRCPSQARSASVIKCDFLISSGSLIPMSALHIVGRMNESFFIDHVDTDWCLRARYNGLSLYGVCSAEMRHTLGDRTMRIGFFGKRRFSLHAPIRNYYIVRNSVLLYKSRHAPWYWIIADIFRNASLIVLHLIISNDRCRHAQCAWLGLKSAVKGGSSA